METFVFSVLIIPFYQKENAKVPVEIVALQFHHRKFALNVLAIAIIVIAPKFAWYVNQDFTLKIQSTEHATDNVP